MKHVYINHQSICTAKLYLPVEKNVQCQQKQQWNKIVNLFKITNKVTWIEVGQVNLLFKFGVCIFYFEQSENWSCIA